MYHSLVDLPSPSSISYMWNFGSLLGCFLVVQLVSGVFLAIHFSGDLSLSFFSVVHLMRDVNWGWMVRLLHSNGASFFFLFLYFHIGRGYYYGSYRLSSVWMSGVTIFLLSMMTAFLGYVLPWGQMSFWAATVITNLLSAVPYFGVVLVEWVWGGFAVSNPTLTRFFAFHFILPFVIVGLVVVHLVYLHKEGSSNPLGVEGDSDSIYFYSMFIVKDMVSLMVFFLFLILVVMVFPFVFMDSENFITSNPLVTPVHIQPEWYFLFAYCILRSIASSVGGVVALVMSVLILYIFPFIYVHKIQGMGGYVMGSMIYWVIVVNWMMLTWVGSCEVEKPFIELGGLFSLLYFFLFFFILLVMWFQDKVME